MSSAHRGDAVEKFIVNTAGVRAEVIASLLCRLRRYSAMTGQLRRIASPLAYLGIAFTYFRAVWQDPTDLLIGRRQRPGANDVDHGTRA